MKSISVIISAYNEARYVAECLKTILSQTKKPEEVIVIDDGSTDSTRDIVASFPVILLKQQHQGYGIGRNKGAKVAKGKILVFVDADMSFDPGFLEKLTAPIEAGKTRGTFNLDEFVSNYDNRWARYWNINQNLYDKRRFNPKSSHDIKDFRAILKTEFDRVGGYSNLGYTDSWSLPQKLGYLPSPVSGAVSYHSNPETLTEVFFHARWIGRRPMRWGLFGQLINLVRHSLPFSFLIGIIKGLNINDIYFVIFKITFDLGYSIGIINRMVSSAKAK